MISLVVDKSLMSEQTDEESEKHADNVLNEDDERLRRLKIIKN